MSLSIASYNIHRCRGRDGCYRPEQIRAVLRSLNTQIIGLQEVEQLHRDPNLLEYLCADGHWQAIHGITMTRDRGHYGNALLTSLPIRSLMRIDLSVPGREPRGALHLHLEHAGRPLEIIATHLGLRPAERRLQIRTLLQQLEQSSNCDCSILLGDLNEWFLWGRPLRWLQRHFSRTPAPPTFPARCPVFALDRIWVSPRRRLTGISVFNTPLARQASDHLPLVARID